MKLNTIVISLFSSSLNVWGDCIDLSGRWEAINCEQNGDPIKMEINYQISMKQFGCEKLQRAIHPDQPVEEIGKIYDLKGLGDESRYFLMKWNATKTKLIMVYSGLSNDNDNLDLSTYMDDYEIRDSVLIVTSRTVNQFDTPYMQANYFNEKNCSYKKLSNL